MIHFSVDIMEIGILKLTKIDYCFISTIDVQVKFTVVITL